MSAAIRRPVRVMQSRRCKSTGRSKVSFLPQPASCVAIPGTREAGILYRILANKIENTPGATVRV